MAYEYIEKNYRILTEELSLLAHKSGRERVALVSVTKSGSDEELLALAAAGATDIGENRPGELCRRGALLSAAGYSPRLHEIGSLQRNKVKYIIGSVSLIHSVDSLRLAEEIERQAERVGRRIPVLIEINSGREENKGGVLPEEAEALFLAIRSLPHLAPSGIMTMGPVCSDPEDIRPFFRIARGVYENLLDKYGFEGEGVLSMGMTDSYRVAVEEGATLVRVGRRLFEKN